jgi:hypothetical protein
MLLTTGSNIASVCRHVQTSLANGDLHTHAALKLATAWLHQLTLIALPTNAYTNKSYCCTPFPTMRSVNNLAAQNSGSCCCHLQRHC